MYSGIPRPMHTGFERETSSEFGSLRVKYRNLIQRGRHRAVEGLALIRAVERRRFRESVKQRFLLEIALLVVFIPFALLVSNGLLRFSMMESVSSSLVYAPFSAAGDFLKMEFSEIRTPSQFWSWVDQVLFQQVFGSGATLNSFAVADENLVLSGIQFRQVRVDLRGNSFCTVEFGTDNGFCFPGFSRGREARVSGAYGLVDTSNGTKTEFLYNWQSEEELQASPYWGTLAFYPGSGFAVNLPLDEIEARRIVQTMAAPGNTSFIDEQTRALFVSLCLYASNTGILGFFNGVIEMGANGIWIPQFNFVSASYNQTLLSYGWTIFTAIASGIVMICQIAVILYSLVREPRSIANFWTLVDLTQSMLFGCAIYYTIYLYGLDIVPTTLGEQLSAGSEFPTGIDGLLHEHDTANEIFAWILLLSGLRLSRQVVILGHFNRIHYTLSVALPDYLHLLGIAFCLFLAYCVCASITLGQNMPEFEDFGSVIVSLVRYYIGDVLYYSMRFSSILGFVVAPLFYGSFYLLFNVLVFGIFLAMTLRAWKLSGNFERQNLAEKAKPSWPKELDSQDFRSCFYRVGCCRRPSSLPYDTIYHLLESFASKELGITPGNLRACARNVYGIGADDNSAALILGRTYVTFDQVLKLVEQKAKELKEYSPVASEFQVAVLFASVPKRAVVPVNREMEKRQNMSLTAIWNGVQVEDDDILAEDFAASAKRIEKMHTLAEANSRLASVAIANALGEIARTQARTARILDYIRRRKGLAASPMLAEGY